MELVTKKSNESRSEYIEECVEDAIEAIITGSYSVESLKKLRKEINEKDRQIVYEESPEDLDIDALRFMHQVVKQTLRQVGAQKKLNTQRARRSMRLRESVVE